MRILRIIASVDPEQGGPVEGLRHSAVLLGMAGHTTEVVTLDHPDADYLADFPVRVHGRGPGFGKYGYTPKIARWIVDNADQFDVAVVHGVWNHAPIGGWQGLRKTRLPYVMFCHGGLDPWFRTAYPFKHLAKQIFWLGAQGWVLHDAYRVLFTSEEEARQARGAFWGTKYDSEIVSYGAASPPNRVTEQRAAFLEKTPRVRDRPYLLFLSRIHPKKGSDLLVQAFANIAANYPELDLVIAGPDQVGMQQELEQLAASAGVAPRIHWPGMLQGDAKWGAYRGAEAFVLPSHGENFGIVVAEALASGTPVLISDKVNIWQKIVSEGGGLAAPDTVAGTQELIDAFLTLPVDRKADMRDRAKYCYETHFGLPAAAKGLERVLLDAIANA